MHIRTSNLWRFSFKIKKKHIGNRFPLISSKGLSNIKKECDIPRIYEGVFLFCHFCVCLHFAEDEIAVLEVILRLKIKRNDWLLADTCPQACVRKQPIIALYCYREGLVAVHQLCSGCRVAVCLLLAVPWIGMLLRFWHLFL